MSAFLVLFDMISSTSGLLINIMVSHRRWQHRVLRSTSSNCLRANASSRNHRRTRIQRRRSSIGLSLRCLANCLACTQIIESTIHTGSFGTSLSSFGTGGATRVADGSSEGGAIVNAPFMSLLFFYYIHG